MGLLTIVIQWDESFIQNNLPKNVTKSEKGHYSTVKEVMFVIGIHERRDGKHPKQSTVER